MREFDFVSFPMRITRIEWESMLRREVVTSLYLVI